MLSLRLIAGFAAISMSVAAAAAGYQDLDALDMQVAAALAGAGTPVPIDRRIKLADCPQAPEISPLAEGAVAVRCPALGWKIRVAVTGGAASNTVVAQSILVRRGDAIELIIAGRGYSVTALGTSLDEGGAGSTVRVKIPTSSLPLSAVVVRAGVVSISS